MGEFNQKKMIRGVFSVFKAGRYSNNLRYFSSGTEVTQKTGGAQSNEVIRQYQNGELVKRSYLALKNSEDIEGYVVNLWRDYFRSTHKAAIALESQLHEHGLDSLDSIELAMR